MSAGSEAGFLQSIGEAPEDNGPCLIYADWLEENGNSERAEFIRVQCELSDPNLAEEKRTSLRHRERDLLNAHRQEWLESMSLPVEDVIFRRGVVESMRISSWSKDPIRKAAAAGHFAALTELDLSGLSLKDDQLKTFLSVCRFPSLKKLLLNHNQITDAGVDTLAQSECFPELATLYLFQNKISDSAQSTLEGSANFKSTHLDLGGREDGYCMSPGEAEVGRRNYIRGNLLPFVTGYFEKYDLLQSAMLIVAQYWCDEANDAVHGCLVVSELFQPTLTGFSAWDEKKRVDPNLPNVNITTQYGHGSIVSLWDQGWDDNSGAIPLWASYADEEGSQEYADYQEVYSPAVMFYRHGGYEFLPRRRDWLDGIRPEWDSEGEES